MFFGDSLVAGVGDPGGGWVARVVSACFDQDLDVTACNLGVRGQTSAQVASRPRMEATPRMLPEGDVRIVVSFGTNDTCLSGRRMRRPAGPYMYGPEAAPHVARPPNRIDFQVCLSRSLTRSACLAGRLSSSS